jgi:hypothetical protein
MATLVPKIMDNPSYKSSKTINLVVGKNLLRSSKSLMLRPYNINKVIFCVLVKTV